jgi:hypothetical protein
MFACPMGLFTRQDGREYHHPIAKNLKNLSFDENSTIAEPKLLISVLLSNPEDDGLQI